MKNMLKDIKTKNNIIMLAVLQIMNIIFSLDSVLIKCASIAWEKNGFFHIHTVALLGIAIGVLGVYAIIWQMILTHVKLVVAYLSKGLVVFWGLIWSAFFFKEEITWINLFGAMIIFSGTLLVNEYE